MGNGLNDSSVILKDVPLHIFYFPLGHIYVVDDTHEGRECLTKIYGCVWGWRGALWYFQFHVSAYIVNKFMLQLCKKASFFCHKISKYCSKVSLMFSQGKLMGN